MRKPAYKSSIKHHVDKIGGNLIDKLDSDYYTKGLIPEWVDKIAVDFKKTSIQVIKDLIQYRNSFEFIKNKKPFRTTKAI